MATEIHKGDWGIEFRDTIEDDDGVINLINYSSIQYLFRKPDGTEVAKNASFYTDGSDGIVKYVMESGVIDQAGFWSYQLLSTISGVPRHSDVGKFPVAKNLGN